MGITAVIADVEHWESCRPGMYGDNEQCDCCGYQDGDLTHFCEWKFLGQF